MSAEIIRGTLDNVDHVFKWATFRFSQEDSVRALHLEGQPVAILPLAAYKGMQAKLKNCEALRDEWRKELAAARQRYERKSGLFSTHEAAILEERINQLTTALKT